MRRDIPALFMIPIFSFHIKKAAFHTRTVHSDTVCFDK